MTHSTPSNPLRLMSPDPDWSLVDRYLSGECSPDEIKVIEQWAAADASHAQLLASVRRIWTEAASPLPVVDEHAAWSELQARVATTRRASGARLAIPPSLQTSRAPRSPWRSPAVAAGLILSLLAGAGGWWKHAEEARLAATAPPREYVTARGQRAEVTLIDGTRVWLSTDSRMQVPQSYGASIRDVTLSGEAYFIVQHDARRPFRVHAGGSVTEDVGTEFDVRAYPGDSEAVAIVSSGRVVLRRADAPPARANATELGRGQMGRLDRSGSVRVVNDVNLEGALAWKSGRLAFEERPLREVAHELERWYDIDIAFGDSALASAPLTATFTSQSADQALAIIAGALSAHYTRDGRTVRFTTTHP